MSEQATTTSPTPVSTLKSLKSKKTSKKTSSKTSKSKKNPAPASASFTALTSGQRKEKLVRSLQRMQSRGVGSSRRLTELARALGWTNREVYGLINGLAGKAGSSPTCLAATGHVKVIDQGEGLAVHLTAKGLKPDFFAMPFSRNGKSE